MNIRRQSIIYLICLINSIQCSYLTYDTGDAQVVTQTSAGRCSSNSGESPRSLTIPFSGQFAKNPTVLAFIKGEDINISKAIFQYAITQTKADCQITITCFTSSIAYVLTYTWVAFDDIRITTIDSGIIDTSSLSSKTFTYTHNNIYATTGFVILQGFGYQGNLDFYLRVTSVTSSKVDVQFTKNTLNLLQIQFLVIIGPAESFTVKQLTSNPITSAQSFFQYIDNVADNDLLITLSGLNWASTNSLRYQVYFTQRTPNTRYDLQTWDGAPLGGAYYSEVWFNKKNYKALYPFLCAMLRIAKKFTRSSISFSLYIAELSKTYKSGDYEIQKLNSGITQWNLLISVPCSQSLKIIGQVLKCIDCLQNMQVINQVCYGGMNSIELHIRLSQTEQVYQQITINVTSSQITITQLVLVPQSTILSLELQKIV